MWWNWKRFHGLTTIFCFWYYYIVILNMLLLLLYLSTTNVRCIFVQSLSLTPIFTLCHFYCFYSLSHSNSLLFIFLYYSFYSKTNPFSLFSLINSILKLFSSYSRPPRDWQFLFFQVSPALLWIHCSQIWSNKLYVC